MKLIFAVLDVSLTMGLTQCYKTEGFFTFISSYELLLIVLLYWHMTMVPTYTSSVFYYLFLYNVYNILHCPTQELQWAHL